MVLYLHPQSTSTTAQNCKGTLAQMVEQWTENPCVPGSIPGGTTKTTHLSGFFVLYWFLNEIIKSFLCKKVPLDSLFL